MSFKSESGKTLNKCRVCMNDDKPMVSLFADRDKLGLFEKLGDITVAQDENKLDALICDTCQLQLANFSIFRHNIKLFDQFFVQPLRGSHVPVTQATPTTTNSLNNDVPMEDDEPDADQLLKTHIELGNESLQQPENRFDQSKGRIEKKGFAGQSSFSQFLTMEGTQMPSIIPYRQSNFSQFVTTEVTEMPSIIPYRLTTPIPVASGRVTKKRALMPVDKLKVERRGRPKKDKPVKIPKKRGRPKKLNLEVIPKTSENSKPDIVIID